MAATFELRPAPLQRAIAIREDCAVEDIGPAVGRLLQEVYGHTAPSAQTAAR